MKLGFAIALATAILSVGASAQNTSSFIYNPEIAQYEYTLGCSGCHGAFGKGDGPMAELMNIETPDLTQLATAAGGTFPFREVLGQIDGRNEVRAHGSDMPVWGDRFMVRAEATEAESEIPEAAMLVTMGRLLSLVYFLESIQEQ